MAAPMKPIERRRAEFQRYKEDVKKRGKPFYPYAMFHDTVMSLVVVSVIIALACVWKFTSGESPEQVGWLGPRYSDPADPGTTNFVPRPDWYFYFLFYLLRIFKWPESVVLGTVGIPTILRGGAEIGPDTLARFYSIHMLLVPGALLGLIGFHLYLIVRLGVTSPPWSKEAAGREPEEEPPARSGLVQPGPRAAGVRRRPTE